MQHAGGRARLELHRQSAVRAAPAVCCTLSSAPIPCTLPPPHTADCADGECAGSGEGGGRGAVPAQERARGGPQPQLGSALGLQGEGCAAAGLYLSYVVLCSVHWVWVGQVLFDPNWDWDVHWVCSTQTQPRVPPVLQTGTPAKSASALSPFQTQALLGDPANPFRNKRLLCCCCRLRPPRGVPRHRALLRARGRSAAALGQGLQAARVDKRAQRHGCDVHAV